MVMAEGRVASAGSRGNNLRVRVDKRRREVNKKKEAEGEKGCVADLLFCKSCRWRRCVCGRLPIFNNG